MLDSIVPLEDGDTKMDEIICHLTRPFKTCLVVAVLIPRTTITLVLLWLGCRWLCATTNFSDIILNAIALEFILALNGLFYSAVVPDRNRREVRYMKLDVSHRTWLSTTKPSCTSFVGPFGWLLLCSIVVVLYFKKLQQVLPEYHFDVHDVCTDWVKRRFAITADA